MKFEGEEAHEAKWQGRRPLAVYIRLLCVEEFTGRCIQNKNVISGVFEIKCKMFQGNRFPSGWRHSAHVTNVPHCGVPLDQRKLTRIITAYPTDNNYRSAMELRLT